MGRPESLRLKKSLCLRHGQLINKQCSLGWRAGCARKAIVPMPASTPPSVRLAEEREGGGEGVQGRKGGLGWAGVPRRMRL